MVMNSGDNFQGIDSTTSSLSTVTTSNWQPLARTGIPLDNLQLGDFNGDGTDDVFTTFGGNFQVSFNDV